MIQLTAEESAALDESEAAAAKGEFATGRRGAGHLGKARPLGLRYTVPDARSLDKVLTELAEQSPQGARHVRDRIQAVTAILLHHPQIGQVTSRPGMLRIVVTPFPDLIFYRAG